MVLTGWYSETTTYRLRNTQQKSKNSLRSKRSTAPYAACAELGEVSVASLGAIEKKDGSYRVIHDATHGVSVNSAIKVRDQICCPGGGDLRRAMQTLPTAFFSLSGDWKHLCCRTGTKKDDVIWVNCVGTFGVSSAAYRALGDLRSSCSASLDGCSLSSLELLATLAAVVLFDAPRGQQLGLRVFG